MRWRDLLSTSVAVLPFLSQRWSFWGEESLSDRDAIRQTLGLYPEIVDFKRWDLLSSVFVPWAEVDYGGMIPSQKCLSEIKAGLSATVANFTSQHMFVTNLIALEKNGLEANATSYVSATMFPEPQQHPGQVAWVYAHYFDKLVKVKQGWRVETRKLALFGPGRAGNLTIFAPP